MAYYNSPFNILSAHEKDGISSAIVHNLVTNNVYVFERKWENIVLAANENDEIANALASKYLIVETKDYITNIVNYFKVKDANNKRLLFYYTVTTKCDLHCKYCFQKHIERKDTSSETIKQFGRWIREGVETSDKNIDEIMLVLFGGDPINSAELSCDLLKTVKEICESFSLGMRSIMVTNGIQKDVNIVSKLINNGLKTVQVSFDGPREIHNLTRSETYDVILSNLEFYQKYFHLKIKYNISKESAKVEAFEEFLSDLEKQEMRKEYIIGLEALQGTSTNLGSGSGCFEYANMELGKVFTNFANIGHARGFRISLKSAFQPPCMFTSEKCFMIETNGDIINCDTAYEIKNFKMGNVYDTPLVKLGKDKNRKYIFELVEKNCAKKQCSYFPLCETGCFFQRYVDNKSFVDVLCREKYIKSFFPQFTNLFLRKEIN